MPSIRSALVAILALFGLFSADAFATEIPIHEGVVFVQEAGVYQAKASFTGIPTPYLYVIDWKDGSTERIGPIDQADLEVTHVYAATGNFNPTFRVFGSNGEASAFLPIFLKGSVMSGVTVVNRPTLVRALAHDSSKGGNGVQEGDRVILFFSGKTKLPAITSANINSLLPVAGKTWGTIWKAYWRNAPQSPTYLGQSGYDALEITFGNAHDTTVAPGDRIQVSKDLGDETSSLLLGGSFNKWLRGDVDGDGLFTPADVVALQSFAFQGTQPPPHLVNADFDSDGAVTPVDVVRLMSYVFNGANPPRQDDF